MVYAGRRARYLEPPRKHARLASVPLLDKLSTLRRSSVRELRMRRGRGTPDTAARGLVTVRASYPAEPDQQFLPHANELAPAEPALPVQRSAAKS